MSPKMSNDYLPPTQRRIRHIVSLQIRNFTPFPARDALAQTLIRRGPSSASPPLQPSDDIELTAASRRRRRISAGSLSTVLNLDGEDEESFGTLAKRKTSSGSRGSFHSFRNSVSGTSTIRPRVRTSSKASSVHLPVTSTFNENADPGSPTEPDGVPGTEHLVTHSQRALEKIVSSRLVETFVTLTATSPPSSPPPGPAAPVANSRKGKEVSVKRAISVAANHRRGASSSSTSSTHPAPSYHVNRSPSLGQPSSPTSSRVKLASSVRQSPSRAMNFPSPPPTPPPASPRPRPHSSGASTISGAHQASAHGYQQESRQVEHPPLPMPIPFYISRAHPPSTNPTFSHLDPQREFASWADTSGTHVKIAIWGHIRGDRLHFPCRPAENGGHSKGKVKEAISPVGSLVEDEPSWKVLDEWLVNLDELEPLSPELTLHQLPSNTLLLNLSSGEVFRVSPVSSQNSQLVPSRAPSPPGVEYNSDGEIEDLRRRLQREAADARRRQRETLNNSLRETKVKQSCAWQDLLALNRIVNLHTCIVDTRESLEAIVRNCDALLKGDMYSANLRECSEREEWINTLHADREHVIKGSAQAKDTIKARRQALESRRNVLAAARMIHEKDVAELAAQGKEVTSERQRHSTLVSSLTLCRTALIQAISFIFPIEPLSAPDLLFTILGVPIPIPTSASDPAPPLSLSSHPDITEDTVATALGYVAQVVQLLSAYLGKGLVYPVTCCGSRSVIKDPISAMVGPRMFPLYSRAVETYRFEYGVFLLNKDIEMLMMDRNLRSLDMRHTLPNLKNLLLTLTTAEEIVKPTVTLPSGARSPMGVMSPLSFDAQYKTTPETTDHENSGYLPRRSKLLSPLAAILRARYPSSAGRPTVRVVDETPEPPVDEERITEAVVDQSSEAVSESSPPIDHGEMKPSVKPSVPHTPSAANGVTSPFEKLTNVDEPPTPPPLSSLS